MSSYERTAAQAVFGQQLDGQFQKLVSDYERPIQQSLFELKRKCAEVEKLETDLSNKDEVPLRQSEDLEYVYTCAEQDLADKSRIHQFARKSLQAAQIQHGYVGSSDGNNVVNNVLVLLIIVFGEALINAAFFSNAHMVAGPAAALLTSFLISMTNVAACTCAGFFIGRYLNYGTNALGSNDSHYKKRRQKAKYQLYTFIGLMVFFHITVGLVRAQETIENVVHSPSAYLQMLQTPEAIFLILMGGCMSVIAWHKGIHSFDCPYPELGALQRAETAAKEDVQDTLDHYQDEIEAYFEDAEKEIEAPIKSQKKAVEQFNKAVTSCQKARRQLEEYVSEAETKCRGELAELITTYRCISGEDQAVPLQALQEMVTFQKYLDIDIPAFRSMPEIASHKSELLLEKQRSVNRLTSIFQNTSSTGAKS